MSTRTQTTAKTRLRSTEDGSKGIWSSLLDSVASGKRLSEKNVMILGGTPESQKDFMDTLSHESQRKGRGAGQNAKRAPVANRFALGYTYHDILDADQDDILARLSCYMLSSPRTSCTTLLEPLLTPKTIGNTLVIILLDWAHPWTWMRELRSWIRILRAVLSGLDVESKELLEENTKEWSERRRGPTIDGVERPTSSDGNVTLPLGPGEYDEPLGLPLCVVAQGAERIESYERDHHWGDPQFDTILQYLRTVLLKHGGSLIYSNSASTPQAAPPAAADGSVPQFGPAVLQALVRGSLDIQSLLQKNALRHNITDRDRILVPPNWDTWGKIKQLGEEFKLEAVSDAWSVEIQPPRPNPVAMPLPKEGDAQLESSQSDQVDPQQDPDYVLVNDDPSESAVLAYEATVKDPNATAADLDKSNHRDIDTHCPSNQEFFTQQSAILERLKADDEAAAKARDAKRPPGETTSSTGVKTPHGVASTGTAAKDIGGASDAKVSEHIGPVQFNIGGIQVDADDALKRLGNMAKNAAPSTPKAQNNAPTSANKSLPLFSPKSESSEEGESKGEEDEQEKLKSFFAGLMSKSNAPTPKKDTEGSSTPRKGE